MIGLLKEWAMGRGGALCPVSSPGRRNDHERRGKFRSEGLAPKEREITSDEKKERRTLSIGGRMNVEKRVRIEKRVF